MRITSSNIEMSSTRTFTSQHQVEERLRVWEGGRRPAFEEMETGAGRASRSALPLDIVELSQPARTALTAPAAACNCEPVKSPDPLSAEDEAVIFMLEKLLEQMTGKRIKLQRLHPTEAFPDRQTQAALEHLHRVAGGSQARTENAPPAGWGLEYDRVEAFTESEQTTFSTEGLVRTADGKEINIELDLTMSRTFIEQNEIHVQLGDAQRKDPLVINFEGQAAQLTTNKFRFDIDADGTKDQISFVSPGSGFLALDKNSDGTVNNGRELFGALTGDGFNELAAYDKDGNQWIDEGDPIFNQLRIWTKNEAGNDRLITLGQAGVGAIYLGNLATPFSLNDSNNQQHGLVQSTGIWLGESGTTGTVQHVDLVV